MIIKVHKGKIVVFTAEPEDLPVGEWIECPKEVRKLKRQIREGRLMHFCAKAAIYDDEGNEIVAEYLGDCYYKSLGEFVNTPNCYAADMMNTVVEAVNQ